MTREKWAEESAQQAASLLVQVTILLFKKLFVWQLKLEVGQKPRNFATALPSPLVTQSAPNTPIAHRMARQEANPDLEAQRHQNLVAPQGKPLNNNYYRAGLGTLYEGIFACFRPVWGYFGRSNNDLVKSIEDDWEIPFEAITGLEWLG
ncbi:unnamed protein product, partial [Strongylus vulgaris]